jgi:lipoprotein signal peptidase
MLNTGISFGLLPGISNLILSLVLVFLIVYALKMRELWGRIGLVMIIIGGAFNLLSRILYGGVIDNLSFFGLIYNNVWDYVIFVGLCLYALAYVRNN